MSKFTPGPWYVSSDCDFVYSVAPEAITDIAKVNATNPADGHLIAAAPDLLEACEAAHTAILDALHAGNLSRDYSNNVIEKIEGAQKKARGGQK